MPKRKNAATYSGIISKVGYKKHTANRDIVQVSNKQDIGYDLTTQLLVNAQTGQPIAPIQMHLKTALGTVLALRPNNISTATSDHKSTSITSIWSCR